MRSTMVLAAVLMIGACGNDPKEVCALACVDRCPDSMTCSAGYCAEPGSTCEPEFESVEAGTGFACALDQFHRSWCWGSNEHHQIEDSEQRVFARAIVSGTRRWDTISAGGGHACALEDDELWCWGRNDRNQVTNSIVGDVRAPIRIEVPGNTVKWSYVSTGYDYTCGIGDGRLYCWGAGSVGKLGNGNVDDAPFPQLVPTDASDWTAIATGLRHTCAVSPSEGVFCWGDGSFGQLGNGQFNLSSTPEHVELAGVTSIAVGQHTTCAVTDVGDLYCWGRAIGGGLGDPSIVDPSGDDTATPVRASDRGGWLAVASAERYACARRDSGAGLEVWCWGTASSGGLGNGRWQSTTFTRVLQDAASLDVGWNGTSNDFGRDEADYDLTCAVSGGDVACWGDNRTAQLGQGAATTTEFPVEVAGGHTWTAIVAGDEHACGISDGNAQCWGSAEFGQAAGVETGSTTPCTVDRCDQATPLMIVDGASTLSAGAAHTCALRGTTITCWGNNEVGQAGSAPSATQPPSDVPGTWAALHDSGAFGACASSTTETWCWGQAFADHEEPDHDAPLDGMSAIVLGDNFGCALDNAAELVCFGSDTTAFGNGLPGTCGDNTCNGGETAATCDADCGPGPLTHLGRAYTAIDSGRRPFVCGLRADARIECWGDNAFGQSGELDAQMFPVDPVIKPFEFTELTGCTQLSTGAKHACALCSGALACWGDASRGAIGAPITDDPITTPRTIAVPLVGDAWLEVAAGDGFTCGRTQLGKAYCWGTSLHGALGSGVTGSNLPITVQH